MNTQTRPFRILTILGSPHDGSSNTRALVEDFVADVAAREVSLEHRVISLGSKTVLPCRGCWSCTRGGPCPQSRKDDLEEIKAAMLDCDMLILASPVYTNQVSAQMKALFDRLFTWCHIFPLLGKLSVAACTTGNEGEKETARFLEKMLATYGTYSLGTLTGKLGFTPGFFPGRNLARAAHRGLVARVARAAREGYRPPVSRLQKRMFKTMQRKMLGVHALHTLRHGPVAGQPKVPWLMRLRTKAAIRRLQLGDEALDRLAGFLAFELDWWRGRGWLDAISFDDLAERPVPRGFDLRARLLAGATG